MKLLDNQPNQIILQRTRAFSIILEALNFNYPDRYADEDFMIERAASQLLNLPSKSAGKAPYTNWFIDLK